jgi:hypothetical protein
MSDPVSVIMGTAIETLDKIGIFKRIEQKLFNAPDKVLEGLEKIFIELEKSFSSIDYVLNEFTSLSFDNDVEISISKKFLNEISFGTIKVPSKDPNNGMLLIVQLADAQARCSEIYNLYSEYLKGWIPTIFNKEESCLGNDKRS